MQTTDRQQQISEGEGICDQQNREIEVDQEQNNIELEQVANTVRLQYFMMLSRIVSLTLNVIYLFYCQFNNQYDVALIVIFAFLFLPVLLTMRNLLRIRKYEYILRLDEWKRIINILPCKVRRAYDEVYEALELSDEKMVVTINCIKLPFLITGLIFVPFYYLIAATLSLILQIIISFITAIGQQLHLYAIKDAIFSFLFPGFFLQRQLRCLGTILFLFDSFPTTFLIVHNKVSMNQGTLATLAIVLNVFHFLLFFIFMRMRPLIYYDSLERAVHELEKKKLYLKSQLEKRVEQEGTNLQQPQTNDSRPLQNMTVEQRNTIVIQIGQSPNANEFFATNNIVN